jgi:SagB-type dehydrogenase family enzyme
VGAMSRGRQGRDDAMMPADPVEEVLPHLQAARCPASLGSLYIENTRNGAFGKQNRKAHQIHFEPIIRTLTAQRPKQYVTRSRISAPPYDGDRDAAKAFGDLVVRRRSSRAFGAGTLEARHLAQVLYWACGVRSTDAAEGYEVYRRNVPSGGNLGSVELYPIVFDVDHLRPGVYHYDALDHALESLFHGDLRQSVRDEVVYQAEFADAAVLVVVSSQVGKIAAKYGDRALRIALLDAGHVGAQLQLGCAALELPCCGTAGTIEDRLHEMIGIDGKTEIVTFAVAIGGRRPSDEDGPARRV